MSNFGKGGIGGDPVLGDTLDGSGTNNANFATPPDGQSGRMQMFVWDTSGQMRDSSFDVGVVIHEYAHGLSTRLVGGPSSVSCLFGLQGGSMGEGWSDYFAASRLEDPLIGPWVSGDPNGIRMFSLDDAPPVGPTYDEFCTYGNDMPPAFCEPHDNGEMWAGLLWDIRREFIALHGPAGIELVDRLAVDAMKLMPCDSSMLDGRDALILADRATNDGAHECLIKEAARARFMGFSAISSGSNDGMPTAADDPWPECGQDGTVHFTREGLEPAQALARYTCADVITVQVVDGNAVAPIVAMVRTAAGDLESVMLQPTTDPGVWAGSIPTDGPLAPTMGDGTLQVVPGDMVTAQYDDASPVAMQLTQAVIDCAPPLEIEGYRITNSTCDADEVNGFPELPGFLDQDESADMVIRFANPMPVAIDGTIRARTTRPDLVTVLPSGAQPFRIDGGLGTARAESVLTLRLDGSNLIRTGDTADIELFLLAPGIDANVPIVITLPLNQDYEVLPNQVIVRDIEGETGGPVGPTWITGATQGPGNDWTLVTCANTTPAGSQAYRNGPDTCMDNYSDLQGDPYLAAPFRLIPPGAAAARVTEVRWMHDIALASESFFGSPEVIDADGVSVVATNDPTSIDTTDPLSLAFGSLAFYADLPDFGITSNTTGWEAEVIPVGPTAFEGVDFSSVFYLSWYFLPDFTEALTGPVPVDAQEEGYYLDDVQVTYDLVSIIPQAMTCVDDVTMLSVPVIADPATGAACAGDAVHVDASLSEAVGCGPLEYRFLVAGTPVPCFSDPLGGMPRMQDPDGWGTTSECYDFPVFDTTYDVEVRCTGVAMPTDVRPATVRIVDISPLLDANPGSFCASAGNSVVVDASGTGVAGCTGTVEYEFRDAAGPLDCDGDGLPDGFTTVATCDLGTSNTSIDVFVAVRCDTLPACEEVSMLTVPALVLLADLIEAGPATPPYCPGGPVPLSAAASGATGCLTGLEYRITTSEGFDSGWSPAFDVMPSFAADGTATVEVRCADDPTCTATLGNPLPIDVREGAVDLTNNADPMDCAGQPFDLGVMETTPVQCTQGLEYRFVRDGQLLDCDGDTNPDDWSGAATCTTDLVSGGADYTVEARCPDDPNCAIPSSAVTITPSGMGMPPVGFLGTLMVRKTAGCPAGVADVILEWSDTMQVPETYVVLRGDTPSRDPLAIRHADADQPRFDDVGVACDGGGVPYRGVAVYFYTVLARDPCTGAAIP